MPAPVFILRGVSGSGKSTIAKVIKDAWDDTIVATADQDVIDSCPCVIISADNHFVGLDGVYRFDPKKLNAAHIAAKANFTMALENPHAAIVVDSTNTRRWEYNDYIVAAERVGRPIEVIRVDCDPALAASRNAHGLPLEMVMRQYNRFEDDERDARITI